ncbi:DNA/RNA-binding protein KIN17-like [Littorina saxatilis]|uniref:DNA/RNA-binding protein Kin17 WH-like domain-containing protein n=1 Tax=Littorina saxatilis TaxID=31220 RepID=A0AAN9BC35_9CAEN
MGKDKPGFLTPKAIANRIKAKGMQKLRWYCQMCQKQCRDENGFKCHMMSESHQRQLLLFAENPDEYVDSFSKEFEEGYCELMKRRFGTKRVHSNIVYQEYIAIRDHVHMNSTMWETLTEFVKWLGREGKCVVDYTEKGWFVQYIDRDPETIRKQESQKAKEKMDMDDEERTSHFIQKQIERAAEMSKTAPTTAEYTELQREDEEQKVTFSMSAAKKEESTVKKIPVSENLFKKPAMKEPGEPSTSKQSSHKSASSSSSSEKKVGEKRKAKSALDEIMEVEERKKERTNRKDHWLSKDIVVKVVFKRLGDKYYKKKAYVKDVKDLFTGIVKMLDSGDVLKVDQTHLETVIPAIGKSVKVVNGAYRGEEATLESLDEKTFSCSIRLSQGLLKGRVLQGIQYEDISKLHTS